MAQVRVDQDPSIVKELETDILQFYGIQLADLDTKNYENRHKTHSTKN